MNAEPRKSPRSVQVLHRWISDHSKEVGIAPARVQRWISYMVLAAALDRVRDEHDEPLFVVKGGVAMELRLRLTARATKDFDAFFRASAEEMLTRLDTALAEPHAGFRFTRNEPNAIGPTGAQRIEVRLSFNDRSWQTVVLELALAEGRMADATEVDKLPAIEISQFGLEGPPYVACIPIRYQIAQKLHACTEEFEGNRDNDRFRDLPDVLMLRGLLADSDLQAVRDACREIFDLRRKHDWPPHLTIPASWVVPYEALAREIEYPVTNVHDAAALMQELIEEINQAT